MRISICTFSALLLFAGTASAASDDLTVVTKHTVNGTPGDTTTSYLGSDHVRMAPGGGHETIIDLKTGVMTTLDDKKKTYYVVTKQDMADLNAKMQERMNSPEMKKGMEAMKGMAAGMESSYEVKKTGETRKIAGYSCEEWSITMTAFSTIKECVTTDLKYSAHALEAYRAFGESMKSSMGSFSPMAKSGENLAEKMKVMKGYPVATSTSIEVMGRKMSTESEVIEIRHGAIAASAWEIPAGYTKIENPMLKSLERHGSTHE
jgi:Domain of unknown function (DUF4412)